MNLLKLKQIVDFEIQNIESCMDNAKDIHVMIKLSNLSNGPSNPLTRISSIYMGFDWEGGRVILVPSEPLFRAEKAVIAAVETTVRGKEYYACPMCYEPVKKRYCPNCGKEIKYEEQQHEHKRQIGQIIKRA